MKKKIFIFLFDGFSDWEIAYLTPEINRNDQFDLIYFSKDGEPVLSMGALRVLPDIALSGIKADDVDMLILPGGTAWEKDENNAIDSLANALFGKGKTIAAICAATTYLGKQGFLNHQKHTSNHIEYLKGIVQEYSGKEHYVDSLAVSGENVITANGIAPIEFAREVFAKLELYNTEDLEKWFQLFKNGIWAG